MKYRDRMMAPNVLTDGWRRRQPTWIGYGIIARCPNQPPQAEQAAEKVSEGSVFVAQPLLAVWFLQHLTKAHSQEWLCYPASAKKRRRDAGATRGGHS